jgi:Complex I intermediate-associated protein 30 (CIA30)
MNRFNTIFLVSIFAFSGSAIAVQGDEMSEPKNLIDFQSPESGEWAVVNDGVMGGLSSSSVRRTDEGTGLFSGELSLENNGGFASVRCLVGLTDLSEFAGLAVRVRGDGRAYQLRLRGNDRFDGVAYRAFFETIDGEWVTARIPFEKFLPTFRGRILTDAPVLDLSQIAQVAFLIADKQPGSFALEIEFVRPFHRE